MRGDFRIGEHLIRSRLNTIKHRETTLRLEPKVMQVLLVLAAHAGDVVTREKIRETVWPDIFVGEDVLVRAISELRRAFQDTPRTQHTIETIPKVGYRLIAPVVDATEEPTTAVVAHEPVAELALWPETEQIPQPIAVQALGVSSGRSRRLLPVAAAMLSLLIVAALGVYTFLKFSTRPAVAGSLLDQAAEPGVVAAHGSCPLISGAVYEVENQQTGALLEVPFASAINGTLLDQWGRNGGGNQRWIANANGPYWTFTSVSSGKRLDVPGGSRSLEVQVDQWQVNHAANQNWIVLPAGDQSCKIISQASGLLLDVARRGIANGTAIIQYTDNDGANQHWIFRLIRKPDSTASSR
jgi:DNA-binding winged helix-turn-helix (wHTH) protein